MHNSDDRRSVALSLRMEVSCELKPGQAVYLAGEEVKATIMFSLPPTAEWEVNLAWATVQIHCFCTVNHNKVLIPGDKNGKSRNCQTELNNNIVTSIDSRLSEELYSE